MDGRRPEYSQLILISGAVASGKTRLAWRLAELARARAILAASIDMDELVEILAGRDWSLVTNEDRQRACELAATVAQRLFDQDVRFVAISGSTVSPYEWEQVLRDLNTTPVTTYVLLRVSLAEAVRRAQEDPTRVATRNSDLLARLHSAIDWARVPHADIDVDTDGLLPDEVAEAVWSRLRME